MNPTPPPFGMSLGRLVAITMSVSFVMSFALMWRGRAPAPAPTPLTAAENPRSPASFARPATIGPGSARAGVVPSASAPAAPAFTPEPAFTAEGPAGSSAEARQPVRVDPALFSPALSNLGVRPPSDGTGVAADPAALAAAQAAAIAEAAAIPTLNPALLVPPYSNQGRRPRPKNPQ